MKGAERDEDGARSRLALDYLEVPALWRASFDGPGSSGFYVAAGPFVAWRTRARAVVEFADASEEIDVSDDVSGWDAGVTAGGGIELGALVFDGRFVWGLRDIDSDRTDEVKVFTRALSLTAGLRF